MYEETPDVIKEKAKDDINPMILSKESLDLEGDEIEGREAKNCLKRSAELQQKVNLKASGNIILVPRHWCFKRQVKRK
ncbi:hypothetical protein TNCV_4929631 [Trichonephila clavipes]|nr:hypothetical protein TNCV_4929631 [Trichonephila clavipes]